MSTSAGAGLLIHQPSTRPRSGRRAGPLGLAAHLTGTHSVLSLREVWAGYRGISILQGIDLHVGDGEIVAVLGRNGVGKTTLMRAIMGAVAVKSGSIELGGTPLT